MRKIILPIIILSLLFGTVSFAQEVELPSPGLPADLSAKALASAEGLPKAGLTPDSPFYFLERISEGIGTFFTFGDLKKAERYAVLAAERVAEAQAVVEKGKPEFAEKALKRYENQLGRALARAEKAKVKGKSIEKVTETIAEATGEHLIVLEEVLEKVPEEAKGTIVRVKEVSMIGQKDALGALARENPERATEINLKAAQARLIRAKVKAEEGESEEVEEAIEEFENQYKFGEEISQIAQGLGKDTTTVEQLVGKTTPIHLEILAEVYEKVPEEVKPAIEKAMEVLVKGYEEAVEALKEKEALGEIPEEVPMPERLPEEVKEKILEGIVVGGPCSYDKFKGGCKITSIINESIIKFKFTPTEPIDIEWVEKSITREREVYARYLGWKCLEKYPITKEDLEKCGIKENATLDCELEVITSGTCTPIIFKFHEPAIIGPEGEKLDCPYECCIGEQYKTKTCPAGYECQENKCIEIVEEKKECLKEGETFDVMMHPDTVCCSGLTMRDWAILDRPVGGEISCIAPVTPIEVCVKCGDGICGEGENWCICPEDCEKPAKILCNEDIDCGADTCHQGRNICHEIKYTCQEGNCSAVSVEYVNYSCARWYYTDLAYPESSKCMDTCGDGICKSPETKFWCPEDCE